MVDVMVTVAFDVDGCLRDARALTDAAERRHENPVQPDEDVRTLMVLMKRMGCRIVLWSGSGELYARQVARECGVSHLVDVFAAKADTSVAPDLTFDDEEMTRGKVNIRIVASGGITPA